MEKASTLEGFDKALFCLDSKLTGVINTKLEIKAIGGFAMMYHGIRNNGYTIDIMQEFEDVGGMYENNYI